MSLGHVALSGTVSKGFIHGHISQISLSGLGVIGSIIGSISGNRWESGG